MESDELFTRIDTAACLWGSPCSQQGGKRLCLHSACDLERFSPLEDNTKRFIHPIIPAFALALVISDKSF